MVVWKRILKGIAWSLGGALALTILGVLGLLAINWSDRPPSAAAERLAAAFRDRPPLSDSDNAYVYAMGLVVAPDGDPRAAGIRRIEWSRSLPGDLNDSASPDPVAVYDEYRSSRSAEVQRIVKACRRLTPECAGALENGEGTLRAWLASEQWLVERYRTLLRHPGWREDVPLDIRAPFAAYSPMLEGQRLQLAQAYLLASENDVAGVRQLLADDARFWRGVLISADLLITKMMATAALTHTFAMGNLILRRLPAESQLSAMPAEWIEPFSVAELSLFRCLTGEWIFNQELVKQPMAPNSFSDSAWERLSIGTVQYATSVLFQPQDLANRYAEVLIKATEALDVPIEQLPAGLERARAMFQEPSAERSWLASPYNPVGTTLLGIMTAGYGSYPVRITDLEGVRRAAVLTAQLRAQKINEHAMAAELAESDIRTPYSGAPFIWNAKERAVQFIGLVPGERGQHTFRY
ncbi:hypothetical protein JM946_21720 [Steroidobacter sp. S1-65]|uniref:Uncharacterized protein n=1 Tax=Steroidobacter gossypii TaxID=2805490 RepID=A0ABS1X2B1_9GAMM|nr:hypothetical protein [Steroidobacter gossypii]MBM0107366.1 hypothetical protein [Steroidobacter gossypii]